MKGLIFKAIIMVILMVGISNYMMYIMTGKSPMEGFSLPSLKNSVPTSVDELKPALGMKQTVYKWVDENGVTQYGSEPPPGHTSKSIELDPNTNIIQAIEMPKEQDGLVETKQEKPQLALPEGPVYSPENIKKLINDAQNVQQTLNDRYNQQNEALKEL